MAYHIYHREPCPDCGRYFVRFDAAEACPYCGSRDAGVYDLVDEIVEQARRMLVAQGNLDLLTWQPMTPADRYVAHAHELLDAFRQVPHLPPATVADEALRHCGIDGTEAEEAHWRRFFLKLLETWAATRNLPLHDLSPAPRHGEPEPEEADGPPLVSHNFRKRRQPQDL